MSDAPSPSPRHSATKGILVAMVCTFFEAFNVPVFWPILVMYFIMLFCITMKRQIKVHPGAEPGRGGQAATWNLPRLHERQEALQAWAGTRARSPLPAVLGHGRCRGTGPGRQPWGWVGKVLVVPSSWARRPVGQGHDLPDGAGLMHTGP